MKYYQYWRTAISIALFFTLLSLVLALVNKNWHSALGWATACVATIGWIKAQVNLAKKEVV